MLVDRQTHTQTDRQTDGYTPLPYQGRVTEQSWTTDFAPVAFTSYMPSPPAMGNEMLHFSYLSLCQHTAVSTL